MPESPTVPGASFETRGLWIPLEPGHAVSPGWTAFTGFRPVGVTWHWTATADLATCDAFLGGANPSRQGMASAHLAVGRSFREGVSQYVSLDDRSWHAGKDQVLRWDGRPLTSPDEKGARTTIGIETVGVGYARPGFEAEPDWIETHDVFGERRMLVQPWTEEQIEMMIEVGRRVIRRWPHLGPRDHHGHHDLCPGYKVDPAGFPFARVLRGIYDDPDLPDPWSGTWTVLGRRRALRELGYATTTEDDPTWHPSDDLALRRFQEDQGLPTNGLWTTSVAWAAWDAR